MLLQTELYPTQYDMTGYPTQAAAGGFGMMSLVYLAVVVVCLVAMVKIFQKAGRKWWEALIPFYNSYVMTQIAGLSILWFVLLFIPLLNFVALFMILHGLSKAFGHGLGFTLGLIFLPFIFMMILGFGSAQYQLGGQPAASSAPQSQSMNTQQPAAPQPMDAQPQV